MATTNSGDADDGSKRLEVGRSVTQPESTASINASIEGLLGFPWVT
jgi:hypothetical protein